MSNKKGLEFWFCSPRAVGRIVYIASLSFQNISFLAQKLIPLNMSGAEFSSKGSILTSLIFRGRGWKPQSVHYSPSLLPHSDQWPRFQPVFSQRLGMTWAKDSPRPGSKLHILSLCMTMRKSKELILGRINNRLCSLEWMHLESRRTQTGLFSTEI